MQYGIFKWRDAKGANVVQGMRTGNVVLGMGGTSAGHRITLPDGTEVYRPQRPTMVRVGTIVNGTYQARA